MDHYEVEQIVEAAKAELEQKIRDLQYEIDHEKDTREREVIEIYQRIRTAFTNNE